MSWHESLFQERDSNQWETKSCSYVFSLFPHWPSICGVRQLLSYNNSLFISPSNVFGSWTKREMGD